MNSDKKEAGVGPTPRNDGGPAFPAIHEGTTRADVSGLSIRDYFAAHASDEDVRAQGEVLRDRLLAQNQIGILPDAWRLIARYMHADAMLKAREQ
jgi:hypothetical protein